MYTEVNKNKQEKKLEKKPTTKKAETVIPILQVSEAIAFLPSGEVPTIPRVFYSAAPCSVAHTKHRSDDDGSTGTYRLGRRRRSSDAP